ncbi:type II toxin-antitoxin system HicA family toxin [Picosynechococcus sp. PCC 8807]|uniref:type II toxin-antitoxin system HicA family toxin n=1 Tax=Picosynechococcus sp. PCC 8807 TaxID=195248 RepID=UPI0008104B6D|nr:type II toxin-antitoxin system HicA family toxin [Picosynechococcus sp. PCC 8807]ANV90656.1 addiction module toxin, HicA family [Picosynechococcus sp. PCC 8807]
MGRLSGFSYREVTKKLRRAGFEFYRSGKGDHEIWFNPATKRTTTIPHHKTIKEGTLRAILQQAQISVEDFLNL